jgi:hypothetical protein
MIFYSDSRPSWLEAFCPNSMEFQSATIRRTTHGSQAARGTVVADTNTCHSLYSAWHCIVYLRSGCIPVRVGPLQQLASEIDVT